MKRVHVEGYGCSLNKGDTEKISALLKDAGYRLEGQADKVDFIVVNTCAVKAPTENKMLKRIRELGRIANKNSSQLIVCGCLPLISPNKILEAYDRAVLLGVDLGEIAGFFGISFPKSELEIENIRVNPAISIIPIARGCIGACAYCCVKQARGELKSYSIEEINRAFIKALAGTKEVWLTANDTGCYGLDLKTDLSELLAVLLENKGEYRIRIGMMNPANAKKFFPKLLKAMENERVYKFLHLPVQSGSDSVLRLMERDYSVKEFEWLIEKTRYKFPDATIATDIIAGFPGETERDFKKSLELIERVRPDIVNVSRFGLRPNTSAELLKERIHGRIAKQRTRILSMKAREIALERNKRFIGRTEHILVSERGIKGNFVGRNNSYKVVVVKSARLGEFYNARIERAFPTYLLGEIVELVECL